jgi:predicted KAP-like P-loop ATPase
MTALISPDQPIESKKEDLFGRVPFAQAIAVTIQRWSGRHSLTIALAGPWGSGKSSLKNMVLEELRLGSPRPCVVEFNPWNYATSDQSAKAFFREISIALKKVDTSRAGKKRADRWERYGKVLTLTSGLAQGAVDAFPTIIALSTLAGIVAVATPNTALSVVQAVIAAALLLVAVALKVSAAFSDNFAKVLHSKISEQPLDELRKQLQGDLMELRTPILVVVDDIDRLDQRETKDLFQHIKANADFPNVIYLLLYQREIVEQNLTTAAINGHDYLEKIVDLQFDLPILSQNDLNQIVFQGIDKVLGSVVGAVAFDKTRWGNVYLGALQYFFATPRNVKRFLSTLGVHVNLFQSGSAFEVNQIDLIALEALRVFEPKVYRAISQAEHLLTASGEGAFDKDERKTQIEAIFATASNDIRDELRELFQHLFPTVSWALGGMSYGSDWNTDWVEELRVCTPQFFPRYFRLTIPSGDISQSRFTSLLSTAGHRADFLAQMHQLHDEGLFEAALSRLDDHKQKISLAHASELLPALFDLGEPLVDSPGVLIGPHMHVVRIALWYVRQEESVERRGQLLLEAMRQSDSLSVPAQLVAGDERRRAKENFQEHDAIFSSDQLEEARQIWLGKLDTKLNNELVTTASNPKFLAMLYRLRAWSSEAVARQWVSALCKTDKGLLVFLVACTVEVATQVLGDHLATTSSKIRLRNVADFVPIEEVERRLAQIPSSKLTEVERRSVEAFKAAASRHDREEAPADDDE